MLQQRDKGDSSNFGELFDAVMSLSQRGEQMARSLDHACIVERSDRSEATYLHVFRESAWYGYRIASHEPYYPCSATYQQILVPRFVEKGALGHYGRFIDESIRRAGKVVADPLEVRAAIVAEERRLAKNSFFEDSNGFSWRWSEKERTWLPEQTTLHRSPQHVPRLRLSPHDCSRIRYRLNFRAQWSFDESNAPIKK